MSNFGMPAGYDAWKTRSPDDEYPPPGEEWGPSEEFEPEPDYDDAPLEWFDCDKCDGYGTVAYRVTVYEHGCGFPHDDTDERSCPACGGEGGWYGYAEGDSPSIAMFDDDTPPGEPTMPATYFHDFIRDNGLPVTVEYSAHDGEPDFDYPGHICDGGGSSPQVTIIKAWPNTPWHNRLAGVTLWDIGRKTRLGRVAARWAAWPARVLMRIDEWWRASLTDAESERFEADLAEHYEPEDPDDDYR